MEIRIDDLSGGEVIELLQEHLTDMYATSPPESVHALDVERLKAPEITFFSAWDNGQLMGCVALRQLSATNAEIKSMRTVKAYRQQGVAKGLLEHLLAYAQTHDIKQLSLETGTQSYFDAARNLYRKLGFLDCGPFGDYRLDPNSHFMTKEL